MTRAGERATIGGARGGDRAHQRRAGAASSARWGSRCRAKCRVVFYLFFGVAIGSKALLEIEPDLEIVGGAALFGFGVGAAPPVVGDGQSTASVLAFGADPRVNRARSPPRRHPARTQITRHTCEEGWSAIGEWTGAPLHRVLEACGMSPAARFVTFHSFDDWVDSIDLLDALHPQTLLAYGMNGRELPVPHGAPLRLRVERQLGYKSMKFVQRIEVTDWLDDGGDKGNPKNGWAWYAGI